MNNEKEEFELLKAWLQARPNDAAIFAADDGKGGFIAQTVNERQEPQEAWGLTIWDAIHNHQEMLERKGAK